MDQGRPHQLQRRVHWERAAGTGPLQLVGMAPRVDSGVWSGPCKGRGVGSSPGSQSGPGGRRGGEAVAWWSRHGAAGAPAGGWVVEEWAVGLPQSATDPGHQALEEKQAVPGAALGLARAPPQLRPLEGDWQPPPSGAHGTLSAGLSTVEGPSLPIPTVVAGPAPVVLTGIARCPQQQPSGN